MAPKRRTHWRANASQIRCLSSNLLMGQLSSEWWQESESFQVAISFGLNIHLCCLCLFNPVAFCQSWLMLGKASIIFPTWSSLPGASWWNQLWSTKLRFVFQLVRKGKRIKRKKHGPIYQRASLNFSEFWSSDRLAAKSTYDLMFHSLSAETAVNILQLHSSDLQLVVAIWCSTLCSSCSPKTSISQTEPQHCLCRNVYPSKWNWTDKVQRIWLAKSSTDAMYIRYKILCVCVCVYVTL